MWRYGGGYWDAVQNAATRAVEARSSEPPDAAARRAFDAARGSWQTAGLSVIGLGGLAVILWLMMFKPF
jgi:predicted amino acid dehydrogenase